MKKERTVMGAQGFFYPDGSAFTVPDAGTASRTAKPGGADPAWIDVGEADWTFTPTAKFEDFKKSSPGKRVLYDKIPIESGLKLKGKFMELSNLIFQLLLGAETLPTSPTAGGQYNPLEGEQVIRGWLELQQYNQRNELINTIDVFVALTIPSDVAFGNQPVDVQVEGDVLFSTLNTGTLT